MGTTPNIILNYSITPQLLMIVDTHHVEDKTQEKKFHKDNRNVISYKAYMLMSYQAHVNAEYYNKSNTIKYLFKYMNKGLDNVAVEVSNKAFSGEDA
ncbi:hypothetical protein Ahy_B07g087271 isoform B [Arachis hypogaea]|uniref:Uncharacterized protein n=1 Tax=Arachis hypogaea TaxID=3818 RepID=A0A444YBQ0_ARAHY|nr:hypothetical protein Ahy_B07g087271 isoform B [Arachis hypogaea]